jgi:hypothetical protein
MSDTVLVIEDDRERPGSRTTAPTPPARLGWSPTRGDACARYGPTAQRTARKPASGGEQNRLLS